MKKLFAILAVMGVLSFGMTQAAMAQDSTATAPLLTSAKSTHKPLIRVYQSFQLQMYSFFSSYITFAA